MNPAPSIRVGCPTVVELSAFADGKLGEPDLSAIGEHLTRCHYCEETLQRLATDSSLVALLQLAGDSPVVLEPECLRMQQVARAMPLQVGRGTDELSEDSTETSRLSTVDVPHDISRRSGDETTQALSAVPSAIGRYQIQSLLGEGGYGRVYLALDPDLNRQVALKVPKFASQFGKQAGGPLVEALLREARTAARLKHPRIVTIHDVGQDDQAGCFVAMEYVEGQSLKQRMFAGRVSLAEATRFVAQAAEAVHYAHKQGLVHRDLKPANLLIDGNGNIKVADFGLAIFEEQQRGRAGEFAGTLAYCSPEQVRGEVHRLDGRTDIWSLGVILYELLTGRRPFGGPNVSDEILHRPPRPPRQIDDAIPLQLESVCLACLAKRAEDRLSTARDVVLQLDEAPHRKEVTSGSSSKRRLLMSASLALGALLVGALAIGVVAGLRRPIPYSLDQLARPFRPLRLLTRQPREIFQPDSSTETHVSYPDREEVLVNAPTGYLLGLGETNSQDFRFQIDISKSEGYGETGIFLGFREIEPDRGQRRWVMEMICLKTYGDDKTFIQRLRVTAVESGSTFSLSHQTILFEEIPPSEIRGATLAVVVRNGVVAEVRWMDRRLPKLATRAVDGQLPDYCGQLGMIVIQGTAWFHNAEFQVLESTTADQSGRID